VRKQAGKEPEAPEFRDGDVFEVQTGQGPSQKESWKVLKAPSASAAAPHAMLVRKLDFLGNEVGKPETVNYKGFAAFLKDASAKPWKPEAAAEPETKEPEAQGNAALDCGPP
jgi:hypothetical protein